MSGHFWCGKGLNGAQSAPRGTAWPMAPFDMPAESGEGSAPSPDPFAFQPPPGPGRGPVSGHGAPGPSMWRVLGDALRDLPALVRAQKGAVALLLLLEAAIGGVPLFVRGASALPGLPLLLAILSQLIPLPFILRFCAHQLGMRNPQALPPGAWQRLVGWGAFCVILGTIQGVGALTVALPRAAVFALTFGAMYFQVRLLALYPALMTWRQWPGIDRVWGPSGAFAVRLIGCFMAIGLPFVLMIAIGLGLAAQWTHQAGDAVALIARLERWLEPWLFAVAALQAVLAVVTVLFGAALRVRLFRLIA